jgi:nitrilase
MSPVNMKVAFAQVASTFEIDTTLEKIVRCITEAKPAHLIVFPEATIGGYPKYHNFGTSLGERTPEGREMFQNYVNGSITVPGPEIDKLASFSQKANMSLVMGVIEKSTESATLYCTAVYIDPVKGYVGKHRKLQPTGFERVIWGQGDGSTLDVFEPSNIPGVIVSAAICWENYMRRM